VADRDIMRLGIAPYWCTPARLILGDAQTEEIVRAILASIAKSFRKEGKIPGLSRMADVIRLFQKGGLSVLDAYTQLRGIVRDAGCHRHAQIAERVSQTVLADVQAGKQLGGTVEEAIAREFCADLVNHHLFDKLRARSPKHRRVDEQRLLICKQAVSPSLQRVAKKLSSDVEGQTFRAPPLQRRARRSTDEILHSSIA
jgi:hypothetical protein